jgi:N-acetylmuramoyl-L-alanine amidase
LKILQEDYLDRSINLASKIENNFKNKVHRKSRGIKQTPLWVLDAAYMPSVLIELGFLSNNEEGVFLNSDVGQNKMAQAIATAIIAYKKEYFGIQSDNTYQDTSTKKITENSTENSSKRTKSKLNIEKSVSKKSETRIQNSEVVFKVQFAAGNKNIKLNPSNFKGLKNVSVRTNNGSFYKYAYGATSDYNVAKQNLKEVKSKGYSSAYIIAFRDGKNISVEEAMK